MQRQTSAAVSREDRAEIMSVVQRHRADRGDVEGARRAFSNSRELLTMDEWAR